MSGPSALAIAAGRFRGTRSRECSRSHRILFGSFRDPDDHPIDTVLLSVFRAPHSYTGEDVVEISSHGGAVAPRAVLASLIAAGARPARPGGFTEGAHRYRRMGLSPAAGGAAADPARS